MSKPEQELRTINLPTVPQRACELPGGPLIAILVGLEQRVAKILDDHRLPAFTNRKDKAFAVRSVIALAANMYRTPRETHDAECYAVEMSEACLAMLLCEERCAEAFEQAVELEGGAVRYVVKVVVPCYADLSCLSMLRDLPHINVVIKLLEDERSWNGKYLEDCDE